MSRIPGVTSTYSKGLFLNHPGYPQRLVQSLGSQVWDESGKSYTDWWSTLGSTILGANHPAITTAMIRQLAKGIVFSLPHALEEETAELLCDMAGVEQLRWCKNGSDATEAAVRLARYITAKECILTTGYHGFHSDLVTATEGKSGGILPRTRDLTLHVTSPQEVRSLLGMVPIACVIAEPIFADGTIWPWAEIKEACHKAGALLIFDEVITGFRYGPGPALSEPAARFPCTLDDAYIVPDLYCFGKAIANGMPLACVAGPRALMQEYEHNVFFSSTAAAECLSLAACKATLEVIQREPVHTYLWKIGQQLIDEYKKLLPPYLVIDPEDISIEDLQDMRPGNIVRLSDTHSLHTLTAPPIVGLPPRTQLRFSSDDMRDRFLTGMTHKGHLLGRDQFIQYCHTEADVQSFAQAAQEVLHGLA